jgi:hypothetical protein
MTLGKAGEETKLNQEDNYCRTRQSRRFNVTLHTPKTATRPWHQGKPSPGSSGQRDPPHAEDGHEAVASINSTAQVEIFQTFAEFRAEAYEPNW